MLQLLFVSLKIYVSSPVIDLLHEVMYKPCGWIRNCIKMGFLSSGLSENGTRVYLNNDLTASVMYAQYGLQEAPSA